MRVKPVASRRVYPVGLLRETCVAAATGHWRNFCVLSRRRIFSMQLANAPVIEFEGSWKSMDTCKPQYDGAPDAEEVVRQAKILIESHPNFVGRSRLFRFEYTEETLVVCGAVPTFYLKQMLQSTLKNLDGVRLLDNRVSVDVSHGFGIPPARNVLR
jgi:hypothetical protein